MCSVYWTYRMSEYIYEVLPPLFTDMRFIKYYIKNDGNTNQT